MSLVRTLQGLKNSGTLATWREQYGQEEVHIYSAEWQAYWKPNAKGYHPSKEEAGIYTLDSAIAYSGHCGPEKKIEYHFLHPLPRKSKAIPGLKALQMKYARDCRMIAGSTALMVLAYNRLGYPAHSKCVADAATFIRLNLKCVYQHEKAQLIKEFEDAKSRQ